MSSPSHRPSAPPGLDPAPVSRVRTIVAGSVGNAVEWFDWTIYASFAIFFSSQFFPDGNETTALLASFGIFAVGFFMRPIGGWLLGIFSDRYGRKAALGLTILMMAGGSLIIAVTPTYAAIGLAAPLLLTLARLLQGLSLGGEYASATTFLTEMAPPHRRGFYSSFVFFSAAVGILAASAVGWVLTTWLSRAEMAEWGWRIPFLLGALGGVAGLWIRRSIPETEAFSESKKAGVEKQPLRTLLREYPVEVLRIIGFSILTTFAFYIFVAYVPTYAIRHVQADPKVAFAANTVALIVFMVVQPLFGALSDRIGRKPQLIVFAAGYLFFFYPLMSTLGPSFGSILTVELFGLVLYAMYTSIGPAIMSEQFPTSVRAVGIGAPYNLMVALLGGTTPYLLTWLQSNGLERWFFYYVLAGAVITLITFIRMPETVGKKLR
ncbi:MULTISPECIES: MFS transporter [Alcaligenes]|uniref:MFS transporter n=2 Tax=Alcaligenes TaxID=507 RepID=A0AB33CU93_ALCFA|nr:MULTISPECIES: MFS transporter [Alcaligenes]ASR89467.1 MFS transporter [Alcaligenes faecalis]MCC9162823.1 MFS transporter [Alcaligenes sp. MMA]MCH4223758.1 MFS transporter [Alcaligenes faecalis]QXR37572.1 MFS transporter [Alcaligenes aquatilis]UQN37577.1 MFS transporter [Alcaligenes aquatilis]